MKIQIRQGCFETNSSSMHCIAIMKSDKVSQKQKDDYFKGRDIVKKEKCWDEKYWNKEIDISVSDLDYGWGFDILNSFEDKVMYAIASIGKDRFEEIQKIVKEVTDQDLLQPIDVKRQYFINTGQKDDEEIKSKDMIKDDEIYWDDKKFEYYRVDTNGNRIYDIAYIPQEEPAYGYIDHQSIGNLQWFLDKYKITLKDFLLDESIIIIIDNDNSAEYAKLFNVGMLSKSDFVVTGLKRDAYYY